MNVEVELPDFGIEGNDEAHVVEWHFEEGERVEEGERLLEVQCEMNSYEVPSPCSGVLIERLVDEDDIVRTGEPVALIDSDDTESDDEVSE